VAHAGPAARPRASPILAAGANATGVRGRVLSQRSFPVGVEAAIVLAVLALVLGLLIFTRIPPDAVLVGGLTLLLVAPTPLATGWKLGVLSAAEAFGGFSNPGMLTVGVLFIVVSGLRETGGIDWIAQSVLGRPRTVRRALARILFPVVVMSTFLNNTPVVAMLIPAVSEWAKKLKLAPSKLMIPLSYAAILGGICSLIGTSTNLVVAGLVITQTDLPPLGMFDITWVGLPCAVVGSVFLLLFGPKLLPTRGSPAAQLSDPRQYTAEMIVPEGSPLVGKSIEQAGLRQLPGSFLTEIDRQGTSILAVGPEETLQANDRLIFAGIVESIRDLQNLRGLVPATNQVFKLDSPRYRRQLFEAVVSATCPIAGKTIRDGRFRNRYNAVVLAVARGGERIERKLGDIELRPGDTLLIEANATFAQQHRDSRDFLLVSAIEDSTPRRHDRALVALLILTGMVLLAASGVFDMLVAAIIAAALMVLTRCCGLNEARNSVDWGVLIVIGAALGLGAAIEKSGAAQLLAGAVLGAAGGDPYLTLIGVYLVTWLMTEILTNNAAVALMFPIAVSAAQQLEASMLPFLMVLMIAGSASFATPIGYQTNLMVYGPGGYRFTDYTRIGIPMSLLMGLTALLVAPRVWPF
jgi:di/tricarboxylate transporter